MSTTVVSILSSAWAQAPTHARVYVGRAGKGMDGYFGNPYRTENGDRMGSIAKYQAYFQDRILKDPEFRARVDDLQGFTLGCFCSPKPCHADVIKAYLDGDLLDAQEW